MNKKRNYTGDFSNIHGFNYQPSVGSTAREIWVDRFDPNVIRRELALGVKFFPNMNTVRIWLSHEPFIFERERFLDHFRMTLDICHSLGFGVIPVLFNNWHSIPDFGGICPEMINYWFKSFGREGKAEHYAFRPYFETMFKLFDSHPALLAWDLCNEPFNSNTTAMVPWLEDIYHSAKRLGAQKPIGISIGAGLDVAEQVAACSDVLMIHPYFAKQNCELPELVRTCRAKGKPVLVTECGWGALDDARHLKNVLDDLDVFRELNLGWLIHAFHESPVADLHRPETFSGPISSAEYMALINLDGSLREGHNAINAYCLTDGDISFDQAVAWLETQARRTIRASQRTMDSGVHAFPPQVGIGYEAFWLRDYAYMLETCADAFTTDELIKACQVFVGAIREGDAASVDCVKFSGEPIYKPGYGSMGSKPVLDGSPFTVSVVWHTWKQTGEKQVLSDSLDALIRTMQAMSVNKETGLAHISSEPGEDRCPYGFTDTVAKRGDVLFTSLLYIEAAQRLAAMLRVMDRPEDAEFWEAAATRAAASINSMLWDAETGLYLAASTQCRQPDIWGSAFAVWLGVADTERQDRIATYFHDNYDAICQQGQVRHLPRGVYWEQAGSRQDTYQNGAYWATPTGWFVYTLARVDEAKAREAVVDMVTCFARHGIFEWILGDMMQCVGYVASATLPLQGIRELRNSQLIR